jgi:type IV pilus assembly protein PilO
MNMVMPTWQTNQELQTKVQDLQTQIEQKQRFQDRINKAQADLDAANKQNRAVQSLFANERSLNTLLIDINRFVGAIQGKLNSFQPQQPLPQAPVLADGSFGPGVNGKLKTYRIDMNVTTTFPQLLSLLRSIEQMQAMLIVKDVRTQISGENPQKFVVDPQGKIIVVGQPKLQTNFQLEALMPLSSEEITSTAPPPAAGTPPAN